MQGSRQHHRISVAHGFVVFAAAIATAIRPRNCTSPNTFSSLRLTPTCKYDHVRARPDQRRLLGPLPYPDPAKPRLVVYGCRSTPTPATYNQGSRSPPSCASLVPPMMVDNEAVVPWVPGEQPRGLDASNASTLDTTQGWAAMVFAAFRLATQLTSQSRKRAHLAAERRRTQRAQLPGATSVSCTSAQSRSEHDTGDGSGRATGIVDCARAWRTSPGPGRELRRPVYILPHVKGPDARRSLAASASTAVTAPHHTEP